MSLIVFTNIELSFYAAAVYVAKAFVPKKIIKKLPININMCQPIRFICFRLDFLCPVEFSL